MSQDRKVLILITRCVPRGPIVGERQFTTGKSGAIVRIVDGGPVETKIPTRVHICLLHIRSLYVFFNFASDLS